MLGYSFHGDLPYWKRYRGFYSLVVCFNFVSRQRSPPKAILPRLVARPDLPQHRYSPSPQHLCSGQAPITFQSTFLLGMRLVASSLLFCGR